MLFAALSTLAFAAPANTCDLYDTMDATEMSQVTQELRAQGFEAGPTRAKGGRSYTRDALRVDVSPDLMVTFHGRSWLRVGPHGDAVGLRLQVGRQDSSALRTRVLDIVGDIRAERDGAPHHAVASRVETALAQMWTAGDTQTLSCISTVGANMPHRTRAERRQVVLQYWDSRLENGAGEGVRSHVEHFVTDTVQQSATPFTREEIETFNRTRRASRPFPLFLEEETTPTGTVLTTSTE